ncbi:MAG: type II secretion system F family protein [Eubacteriales bacterium]|nr:type II secretion system F family protein [Eubacteriales bacterium]
MWIHIIVLGVLLAAVWAQKSGHLSNIIEIENKDFRIFIIILLIADGMGLFITLSNGASSLSDMRIEKDELGVREETLNVEIDGNRSVFKVEIPGKEIESKDDSTEEKTKSWKEELQESIRQYNEAKNDPEYYYLPETWDKQKLYWRKPADTSGMLLSALGLLAAVMLLLMGSRQKLKAVQKRQEQMLMDYPALIMKFTLLIQAGLSLRKTFQKIAVDYKKSKIENRWAYEEIIAACYEMDSGISEQEAYYRFGERCGQVKYKVFATLLVQNLHMGSTYLAAMLEQEAANAWEERKRKAKVLGEVAATKLLIPMIMMMFVVMAIVMIPAFLSFYSA